MVPFAALALCALAAPDDLLPETPEGWRYERLDFPLTFAPELEYEGFEELRFAPGMFDAGSESYFSYVLAIRIEEDVDVDVAFVKSFLEAYYFGLCRSVAEGSGLEIDDDKLSVDVEFDGRDYAATIEMVDAFVTGKPITLAVELSVLPGATTTELFGIASPKPETAPIWKELLAIRKRWREDQPIAVLLNHLYVVTDGATYDALAGSKFLRETFGSSEERDTVRADMSYSGLYFYGQDTYFEFLKPSAALPLGGTAIAFGIEEEGGTKALADDLDGRGVTTFVGPITRGIDGEQVPWFEILGVQKPHAESRFELFSLEYDPRFLASWHADLAPARSGITRRDVLERYAAKLGQAELHAGGLFQDVTEIRLALDDGQRERLLEVCRASGWSVEGSEDAWTCDGPQVRLVVATSAEPGGVTGFVVSLRRPLEREPLRLGKAAVRFEGTTATFTF